jgi:ubiquitin carboxyl-terminal hydrolase 8
MQCPVPLWTHCHRWRQTITEGKLVEVRDTSSRADRPKWYKGVVRRVGSPDGRPEIIVGGATLELHDDPDGRRDEEGNFIKKPLLLLQRTEQILVEVEEEKQSHSLMVAAAVPSDAKVGDFPKPEPPFLRWVNLYGEEVCQAGTHMKIESDGDLGVVTLRYEYDSSRKPVEVMKSWNNMYGQGFMKESLVGTPPAPGSVGMHNLGNSCFLNSIIQCLNHIEPLTQFFLKGDYVHDMNRKNPLGSGGRVATAYASLLKEIWSNKYSALAPRMLKQTVAIFAPQFNNSYQHDSQEFCQFLMDGLHEDCNRVKSKPYVEELEGFGMEDEKAAVETWRKHLLRHDSVIVDHFQGMHRSHLTCPGCGRESIKFDVYSTISVPLAEDKNGLSAIKLEDCIEKFMEGEQLDELNAWYCPGCKKHVCALKMIALWSVPDVLIIHLKRFQFDHCSVRNDIVRSKIDLTVKFPIDALDLRKHVLGPVDESAPPIYKVTYFT